MAAEVHRLFFALWPDEATRAALGRAVAALRSQHSASEARGRWVDAARYHVTLQFLGGHAGPFPEALARSACDVAAALPKPAPFGLRIDVAASFRGRAAPWWLGTSRLPDALADLWRRLGQGLRDAGLPHDARGDFTPHVTVMRDAGRRLPETALGDAALNWPVRSFALMRSGAGGYAVIGTWPLAATA